MTNTMIVPDGQDELTAMLAEAGLIAPSSPALPEEIEHIEGLEEIAGTELMAEIEEIVPVEAVEEIIDEVPGEVLEMIEGTIAHAEAKAEAYATQESDVDLINVPVVATTTPLPGKPARAKRAASSAPREPRFNGSAGEFVAAALADDGLKAVVDGMPIKVREKAVNLVEHVTKGKALSVYTQVAVDMLKTEGKLSAKKLVEHLQVVSKKNGGAGYSIGTARSQAQQQMTLLQGFGIAAKTGTELVPSASSPLWAKLNPVAEAA